MRIKPILTMALLALFVTGNASAADMEHKGHGMMKHGKSTEDTRISLNLPPMMKQHQLANMRNHLDAVSRIVAAIGEDDFDGASKIASGELGMTEKMKKMCNRFDNEAFKTMGLAFHASGDELAKTLKTGDVKASLSALNKTMNYCVSCHATFRQ